MNRLEAPPQGVMPFAKAEAEGAAARMGKQEKQDEML